MNVQTVLDWWTHSENRQALFVILGILVVIWLTIQRDRKIKAHHRFLEQINASGRTALPSKNEAEEADEKEEEDDDEEDDEPSESTSQWLHTRPQEDLMATEDDNDFLEDEIESAKLITKVETIIHETLEVYYNPKTKTVTLCATSDDYDDQWYILSPLVAADLVSGLQEGIAILHNTKDAPKQTPAEVSMEEPA